MSNQVKACQNCKSEFHVEPDDFAFYEKINVPPPTFCPDCRRQRRLAWRNERGFYRRTCDLCAQNIIALYPADAPFPGVVDEVRWFVYERAPAQLLPSELQPTGAFRFAYDLHGDPTAEPLVQYVGEVDR